MISYSLFIYLLQLMQRDQKHLINFYAAYYLFMCNYI